MRKLLAVLLMLSSFCVAAAEDDERAVLAHRLVEAMGIEARFAEQVDGCIPSKEIMATRIAAAYRERPGDFYGISPQSAYWPEVEQAWHAYYAANCAAAGKPSEEIFVRTYAARMSLAELRDAITFYGSPAGSAQLAANRQACLEISAAYRSADSGETGKAAHAFRVAMRELKMKYVANPK